MLDLLRAPPGCHGGCTSLDLSSPRAGHAAKLARVGHVTVHALPRRARAPRALAAALLLLAWWALLPPAQKLRAVCAAAAYSGIEFVFTFLHEGEAFTSFAQFWGNLLYTPVLLDGYWWLLAPQQRGVPGAALYVLLFPLNVWLLEIVLDRVFIAVYGRNVAWCYCTSADHGCGGAVRLGHGVFWLMLGLACLCVYPRAKAFSVAVFES